MAKIVFTHTHTGTHTQTHTQTHAHRHTHIHTQTHAHTLIHIHTHTHTHQDLQKIENWARENKMHFNENKSKVLLMTKKTSGDNRTLNIYLNNKRLEQVSELNYLGIFY
jgi:hypothetical protein